MKKRLLLLAITLMMIAGLLMVFTLPAAAADAPTNLRIEHSETNGIPAQIDAFKAKTGGTNQNPTYTYQLYLPGNVDAENCFLSWDGGATATVGGNTYASGSCPIPPVNTQTTYTFKNGNHTATCNIITYQGSASVIPVFILVDESDGKPTIAEMDADDDHVVTCSGTIFIDGEEYVMTKMKGRGNATWEKAEDKKPYNITLDTKINFPGIDSETTKKWSFLAEVLDRSLLCNRAGFFLANELGIGQDTASADVWMNGEYQGCYTVTPKTDSFVTKDGYMIEQDNYQEKLSVANGGDPQFSLDGLVSNVHGWSSAYNLITVKKMGDNLLKNDAGMVDDENPIIINAAAAEIKTWLQDAWDAIRSGNGYNNKGKYYTDYIDIESFAKMYLMHEYVKSFDVCAGSILFHRDGQTDGVYLLTAGPIWDLDNAMGSTCNNTDLGQGSDRRSGAGDFIPIITEYKTSIYKTLYTKHQDFRDEVKRQYNINQAAFDSLERDVEQMISEIADSAQMNHIKVLDISHKQWYDNHYYEKDTTLGSNPYVQSYKATVTNSKTNWANCAANLKTYIHARSLWFQSNYTDPNFIDPEECDHAYEEIASVTPTCTSVGCITYRCSLCGDRKTEPSSMVPHSFDEKGICTVCGTRAIEINIICDEHASVTVYSTKGFNEAVAIGATSANPRDKDSGQIVGSGSGQINFVVNLEEGYAVSSITAEPADAYNSLKYPGKADVENSYSITKVTGEFTITVSTALRTYPITFVNYDETELQSSNVAYGETPIYSGETPTKAPDAQYTYSFAGWMADGSTEIISELPAVAGEAIYTAAYTPALRSYTVTFKNEEGTVLQSSNVAYGETPVYTGETPTKDPDAQYTYTFAGWMADGSTEIISELSDVTGEATYTAAYTPFLRSYTVTFKNEDGTVLQSSDVAYGETPIYSGETPTKASDSQYTYTFAGWTANGSVDILDALPAVTGPATYTAAFNSTEIIGYTVNLNNIANTTASIDHLEDSNSYYGETVFTVSCDKACAVLYTTDGGATYTRLRGTEGEGCYIFTVDVTQEMTVVVVMKSDVNMDGKINALDVAMTKAGQLNKITLSPLQKQIADVNADGKLNALDVAMTKAGQLNKITLTWDM